MTTALSVAALFGEGTPVLVADEAGDTNFIAAPAGTIAPEQLARLQRLGHGTVVLGMSGGVAERLRLPAPAAAGPGEQLRLITPISAAGSVDGGWSLHDRAMTMRIVADPRSGPEAVTVPGHVLAGQIQPGGRGAAAAALELALLAGLEPVVALSPVLEEAGGVVPLAAALDDPRLKWLPRASSSELHGHAAFRSAKDLAVTCALPMRDGVFRAVGFGQGNDDRATIAFVHGDPASVADPLVHVHLACQLGDVFGSLRCGCRAELDDAIHAVVAAGCGVIVYTQPLQPSFLECPRGRGFAQPTVVGLLRAIGIDTAATQTRFGPAQERVSGSMEACA